MAKSLAQAGLTVDSSLRAYYKLEDANDSSANGYNLTNGGTSTFTPGIHVNALTLNGSSQYLFGNTNLGITGTTNNITISGWIKLTALPGSGANMQFFFLQVINGANRYFYRISITNSSGTYILNTTHRASYNFPAPPTTGAWYHVALTSNTSNNNILYLNGVSVAQSTAADAASSGGLANQCSIGAIYWSASSKDSYFNGQIDDVGVFNRVLTAEEILDIYTGGQPKVIMVD